ncbi:MAG: phenylalanine--tRNA ligase subunit beta [Candidatus Buchananbacteria bacterium]|nr:phenylalanine--tRNA ligase subunit beta [Candidatus Buchananbacteria bacterium]
MNLNISYNWLKEYVATKDSARDFAKKLTVSGPTIDFIHELKPTFKKVVVGEIIKIDKHPQADKLQVCQVSVGEKKPLNIVCGASNIQAGQKVPVVLVGGEVSGNEVKKAVLRGVESEGMMCSQKELGLGEDHSGIFILPSYTKVGLLLEKVMNLEDSIFDIEVTSNRPDAMNIIGLAREAAAIVDAKYTYHESKPNLKIGQEIKLAVSVKEPKLCPRYRAIVMTSVKVESSPLWLQARLLSAGLRPINNLVDITNYILLEFGQPMHVFDFDKLQNQEIIVRKSKKGETLLALDGKNYELVENSLVIADGKNPVAVAGIMGGELSAATITTKTIVLESANFDQLSVRRTARALNLHSDSSNLFEKGLAPENTTPAILRAIELVAELASGQVASKLFDCANYSSKTKKIDLSSKEVERVLGLEIKQAEIKSILERLGFNVSGTTALKVEVPYWRDNDIDGPHDLIEEIARVYGYHKLPAKLMASELPEGESKPEFFWEDKTKDVLVGLGYSENINYSFISERLIKNSALKIEDHLKIANPLSGDFEYMRISLVPGLLQSVKENERMVKDLKIFELSKSYLNNENNLPNEKTDLCLARAEDSTDKAFFDVKGALTVVLQKLNIEDFALKPLSQELPYWQKNESAEIIIGDNKIGIIGTINRETLQLFNIKKSPALVEIDFAKLLKSAKDSPTYKPIAKFPAIDLDISMEIAENILYDEVVGFIKNINDLIKQVLFLSVYQDQNIPKGKKALAIRINYRDDNKTLELAEAQKIHNKVVEKLKKEYNISIR